MAIEEFFVISDHAFLSADKQEFYDYKAITDKAYKEGPYPILGNYKVNYDFHNYRTITSRYFKNISPKVGDKLFIVSQTRYDKTELKRHFTLVKNSDEADFVVFPRPSDMRTHVHYSYYLDHWCAYPDKRLIFLGRSEQHVRDIVASYDSSLPLPIQVYHSSVFGMNLVDRNDNITKTGQAILTLFQEKYTCPVITEDSIQITFGREITVDTLLYFQSILSLPHTKDNLDSAILAIHNLGTYNWRPISRVIALVLSTCVKQPNNIVYYIQTTNGAWSKLVKEMIVNLGWSCTPRTDEELILGQQFLLRLLNLSEGSEISLTTYNDNAFKKLNVSLDKLNLYFDISFTAIKK